MKARNFFPLLFLIAGCIGEDVVPDFVEPKIIIQNPIVNLQVGDMHTLSARVLDNTGAPVEAEVNWTSSDESIMVVSQAGTIEGISEGTATVTAQSDTLSTTIDITVSMEETEEMNFRTANIQTTSSYPLSGTAILTIEPGTMKLDLLEDFNTTSALPGLYVYLTNNPNTIDGALELGPVEEFTGAQEYAVPAEVELFTYNFVLFYCKPFLVKVGDAELD